MANSIKSIIPGAARCYQQHRKGVLMHCLHAQNPHLPAPPYSHSTQSGCGGGGVETSFTESSQTREVLSPTCETNVFHAMFSEMK